MQPGGSFTPDCGSHYSTAILVPYRDRMEHLDTFLAYMHSFLKNQNLHYKIYVASQTFDGDFNRGALLNFAFESAISEHEWNCLIFHDVDLLPENVSLSYTCQPYKAIHLNALPSNHQYKLKYESYFGGVSGLSPQQFRKVNGFSNQFFGWGGEDDDLFNRLRHENMSLIRPIGDIGRYFALGHAKATPSQDRFKLVNSGLTRMSWDGLNSMGQASKLISKVEEPLYTNYTVALKKYTKH